MLSPLDRMDRKRVNRYREFPERWPPSFDARAPPGRKGRQMSRQFRAPTPQPRFAAVRGGVVVLTALIVVAVAAAARSPPPGRPLPEQRRGRRAFVSRHDGLRRSGVRQELQPVHGHRPPERPVRQGRGLRRPHRLARGRQADAAVARAQLEVEQRQQDADAAAREGRQVVGRQGADRRRTSSTASPPASRTR